MLWGVGITTFSWIFVTLITPATQTETLARFYNKVTPYGMGWNPFRRILGEKGIQLKKSHDQFTLDLGSMLSGVLFVYTFLFATGYLLYGNYLGALILFGVAFVAAWVIFSLWKKKKPRK